MKTGNFLKSMLSLATFILAFFLPSIGKAETLCEQHAPDTYLPIFGGTPASNGLVSGQTGVKIWLKGTLTIDADFVMNNWVVRTSPGASIIVNAGVSLHVDHTDLFCCTDFWNGISLKENSKLMMKYSRVEDAEAAISSKATNFLLSLYSNTFNRNKFGINSLSASYSYMNMANFENNIFSCTTPRNDGVITSDAGIYAYNTLSSFFEGTPNKFIQQQNGIWLSKSNFEIKGCTFTGCEIGIKLTNKSRLVQKGLGKFASEPTFISCVYGIKSEYSGYSATDNFVSNLILCGFYSKGTATTPIVIANNRIQATTADNPFASGVRFDNGNTIYIDEIKNNLFETEAFLTFCILISPNYQNHGGLNIKDNVFDIETVGELAEIRLSSCYGTMVFENNVLDMTTSIGGALGYHFHDASSLSQHRVEGNTISSQGHSNGYYSQSGVVNFCNNFASGGAKGFEFLGDCFGTVLSESQISSNSTGLLIHDKIGPQNLLGNCWDVISSNDLAVDCDGIDPTLSQFTVDGTIPCHYPAGSIEPPSLFDPSGTGYIPCTTVLVENLTGLDLQIADGSISQSTTDALGIWEAERYLYRKLYLYPALMPTGTQAAAFYQAQGAGKIGEFHQAELATRAAGIMPGGLMIQNEAALVNLFTKLQEVASLNGQLVTQPNNTILQAQREATIVAALLYANDLELVQSTMENTIATQANMALSALTALTCDNSWQQNEKTVRYLSLLRASQDARDFTETELDQLRDIAEQCPEQGGDFVLLARALVMDAEGLGCYEPSPNDYGCANPIPLKKPFGNGDNQAEMTTAPNPANEYALVKFINPTEGELRVVDMQGRLTHKVGVQEDSPDIFLETNKWPNGIYLCQYWVNGKIVAVKKSIISH